VVRNTSLRNQMRQRKQFAAADETNYVSMPRDLHQRCKLSASTTNLPTMMSSSAGPSSINKRRKVDDSASLGAECCLSDLPAEALKQVTSYLAAPSHVLFAAALSNASSDDERNSSVVLGGDGEQLSILDFGMIEAALAAKLSDNDVRAALLSIDAVNNVKKIKLTNCMNVTGAGLEPLRGSLMIEQIDLSLVGKNNEEDLDLLDANPQMSRDIVLPILDSIIERGEECALKHLNFPKKRRKAPLEED
jgi:hypothetical protein